MTPEDQERLRKQREKDIALAWKDLAGNKSFLFIFAEDLQRKFKPMGDSFKADEGWNAIPAAKRDGNREVIAHMVKRLGIAQHVIDEDAIEKPAEAVINFPGQKKRKTNNTI